ncbi:unnamed protein product [Calicophoron daubneyi]|uniref:G-protein coupled receptors family 1 profile domain-containing protein n=1 Tax=Calicophoron daubneyi TaxID=300641 RepID=A0AAV2T7F0_CALDB
MDIHPPQLSLIGRVLVSLVVTVVVIVATVGNVAVIYLLNGGRSTVRNRSRVIVRKSILTRNSVTCIFLLNLSIADVLHILVCAPFTLVADFLLIYWPFGEFLCRFVNYVQGVVVFLCAFTHVIISFDRLWATTCPIWRRRKLTSTRARLIVLAIWLCSMIIPVPSLLVCRLVQSDDGLNHCQEVWPGSSMNSSLLNGTNETGVDGDYMNSPIETAYNLTSLLFQYVIPLVVITTTYSVIVCRVWGSPAPGEGNVQRDEKRCLARKKLIKMVIIVATLYAGSQLPRHIIYLVTMKSPNAFERETMMYVWLVCQLCTWSATCYNPFIYAWMNRAFRREILDLIPMICCYCCCCCCCADRGSNREEPAETMIECEQPFTNGARRDIRGAGTLEEEAETKV